jgi:hypothetical protein
LIAAVALAGARGFHRAGPPVAAERGSGVIAFASAALGVSAYESCVATRRDSLALRIPAFSGFCGLGCLLCVNEIFTASDRLTAIGTWLGSIRCNISCYLALFQLKAVFHAIDDECFCDCCGDRVDGFVQFQQARAGRG